MQAKPDPAVEAARKVWESQKSIPFAHDALWSTNSLIPAAREALKPIRERHRPFDRPVRYGSKETERVCIYCLGPKKWPCLDALDAYPTAELER